MSKHQVCCQLKLMHDKLFMFDLKIQNMNMGLLIKYYNLQFSYSWHLGFLPGCIFRLIWHRTLDRPVTRVFRIRIPDTENLESTFVETKMGIVNLESKIIRKIAMLTNCDQNCKARPHVLFLSEMHNHRLLKKLF